MKPNNGSIIFESTGREVDATCDVIGLCVGQPDNMFNNAGYLEVKEGYDGSFDFGKTLASVERVELADFMIEKWTEYKTL